MSHSINGLGPTGIRTETRVSPASAIMLALKWVSLGLECVTITDGQGKPVPVDQFRHLFKEQRRNPQARLRAGRA